MILPQPYVPVRVFRNRDGKDPIIKVAEWNPFWDSWLDANTLDRLGSRNWVSWWRYM